ncbi:MAG: PfkB family carbohydrate kinase [Nitrososphaerales archaeon]|nr:PfkB family carbohydrate kinase [Nitrososphaerales archaeon]
MNQRRIRTAGGGLLTVVGAVNWDISVFEERFARPGEEVPVRQVEEFSGGKGANVAVACARILGRGRVAFIGALGDDDISGRQVSALKEEGVITDGLVWVRGSRSGRAYILVDGNGRKTIHTHFGANERITPQHLAGGGVADVLSRTTMLIVMDPPVPTALAAARAARGRGAKILYSPGVRTREGIRALEKVVQLSDYTVVDTHELRNLYQRRDEEVALERFRESHPKLTIVATLGERGCMVARDEITSNVSGVDLSLLGKRAVNSTGSGDAFLGVFASYVLMGTNALDAVNWANLAGALKATKYETRGSPTRGELESSMAKLERIRRSRLGLPESRASWPGRRR